MTSLHDDGVLMRNGNLLSSVLFRDHRVMDVLPLGRHFILKADKQSNTDILFDKNDVMANVTITKGESRFVLNFSSEALLNDALRRFLNPVMQRFLGELIHSDEGPVVIFNRKAPGIVELIGSQREQLLEETGNLTVELSRKAMSLIEFSCASEQSGSEKRRVH